MYKFLTMSLLALVLFTLWHTPTIHEGRPERKIAQSRSITRNRVIEPERVIEDVHPQSIAEEVVRLKHARVVMADYDLIRRDFPHIRKLSNPEIDEWILNQTAYVSKPQAAQKVVNTPIEITGQTRIAQRPPSYGRALVFQMKDPKNQNLDIGLIDVKGSGALAPGQKDHGNGVATLGECVREFLYENLVRDVLDDADLPNKTVGSYAVVDAGFGVKHADGSSSPAGLYLRQAQHRINYTGSWLDPDVRTNLQSVLRKYGIDPNTNVQGTYNNDIFDFGHYVVKNDLVEIDSQKQIPFDVWGYDKSITTDKFDRWFYSKKDNPWNWSHELADAFAGNRANRHDAWTHYLNLLNPARAKLTLNREKDYALDGYVSSRDVTNFLKRMQVEKDIFILENIRHNLLHKNRLQEKVWDSLAALEELTKSLKLLRNEKDTHQLRFLIVQRAMALEVNKDLPHEVGLLFHHLSLADKAKMNIPGASVDNQSCVNMAQAIMSGH